MEQRTNTLIDELKRQQGILKLNDAEFAAMLGISRPQWSMIRSGKFDIGVTFLSGVIANFPGLSDQVLAELDARGREQIGSSAAS